MKAILISTVALLIASHGNCEENKTASLSAEIRNAKAFAGGIPTITLDHVLTNLTDKPIRLAKRWNSWGADQWSFLLTDKAGDRFVFSNPQNEWFANFLDVFTIAPRGSYTMKCKLCLSRIDHSFEEEFAVILPSIDPERKKAEKFTEIKSNWQYPVQLVGYFSATKIHKMNDNDAASTNWTGSISSAVINIEKAEQPADGKTPEAPQSPR